MTGILSSSRIRHAVIATVLFASACAVIFEPAGVLSRTLIFALTFVAVLWATDAQSTVATFLWLRSHAVEASFVAFFTLYKGFPTFVKQIFTVVESRKRLTTEPDSSISNHPVTSVVAC